MMPTHLIHFSYATNVDHKSITICLTCQYKTVSRTFSRKKQYIVLTRVAESIFSREFTHIDTSYIFRPEKVQSFQ